MHKSDDLIISMNLVIISLLSFLGGRALRRKVSHSFSSAHSPDRTTSEGTTTRATPTRIGQRAEKLPTLEGVRRGEHACRDTNEDPACAMFMVLSDLSAIKRHVLRHDESDEGEASPH